MKEYKSTKTEILRMRRENVRHAKALIKSLQLGMRRYAKGSNVESSYLSEKINKLIKVIDRMNTDKFL